MNFKYKESLVAFLGGACIALISWIVPWNKAIPFWWVVVLLVAIVCLVWYIIILKQWYLENEVMPKITVISQKENEILFKTNFKNLMLTNGYLMVFFTENKYQRLYGIAHINNIQTNYLQATIIPIDKEDGKVLTTENIVLKPIINDDGIDAIVAMKI